MRAPRRRGFKLVELMVVTLIVGVALGILLRALSAAREAGRRTQCMNNMRQLGLGLLNFTTSKNRFPNAGTFFDDPAVHQGDPTRSSIYRSLVEPSSYSATANPWLYNWIVDVLPYLDSSDEANCWNKQESYLGTTPCAPSRPGNLVLSSTALGVLRCPDDPTTRPGQGNLSYVVNGGFARWHAIPVGWRGGPADGKSGNGGVLQWAPPGTPWQESQAVLRKLGVMFLGTHTRNQPWDVAIAPADVSDGASNTLLLAENTLAGYAKGSPVAGGVVTNWACPLPNFCMFLASDNVCESPRGSTDCLGGQLQPVSQGGLGRMGRGWARASQAGTFEEINYGQNLTIEGSFPFANSGHPGGGNFVFCDGATRFLADSIDGTVYARLITPAGGKLPPALLQTPLSPTVWDEIR